MVFDWGSRLFKCTSVTWINILIIFSEINETENTSPVRLSNLYWCQITLVPYDPPLLTVLLCLKLSCVFLPGIWHISCGFLELIVELCVRPTGLVRTVAFLLLCWVKEKITENWKQCCFSCQDLTSAKQTSMMTWGRLLLLDPNHNQKPSTAQGKIVYFFCTCAPMYSSAEIPHLTFKHLNN